MTDLAPETPSFEAFQLRAPLQQALRDVGYTAPTLVQRETFALIAEGRDVVVQARTGSGKTAAFALPLLDRLVKPGAGVQVLTLCPTRELAHQVAGEFERLGQHLGARTTPIYGGAAMGPQVEALAGKTDVVAGTPGRVLDHLRRGTLDLRGLKAVVLDEGDEMLSMGFAEELNAILEQCPRNRQTLIFSATMPDQMARIAQRHQRESVAVALSSDNIAPNEITHLAYFSALGSRLVDLARVLKAEKPDAALIFCNTRHETELAARTLQQQGLVADYLHGDLTQAEREKVLGRLRDETLAYLVCTDVAARGIDIPHLTHVFHVGFPESPETYIHRSGRTGRAGRRGTSVALIGPADIGNLYFLRLTYGIRPIERSLPTDGEARTQREAERVLFLREAFQKPADDESRSLARRLLTLDKADDIVAGLIAAFFHVSAAAPQAPTLASPTPAAPATEAVSTPPPRVSTERRERRERSAPREDRGAPPQSAPKAPQADEALHTEVSKPTLEVRPRRVDVRHADQNDVDFEIESLPMEDLRLAVGRQHGARAGDLVRLVRDRAGLGRRDVGRVSVRDRVTLMGVRADRVEHVLDALRDQQLGEHPLAAERHRGNTTEVREVTAPPADS